MKEINQDRLHIFLRIKVSKTYKTKTETDHAQKEDSWILKNNTLFTISVK
jgi:hypothetical protein